MPALQFPTNPSDGQIFDLWVWSDAKNSWEWDVEPRRVFATIMIVAGGGGGGQRIGGGGGGGGVITKEDTFLGSYTVTVGAGGAGSTDQSVDASRGSDSSFSDVVGIGGGGGASFNNSKTDQRDGGSGGGSSGYSGGGGVRGDSIQPSPGFGNEGGQRTANYGSGGGGGAGAAGTSRGTSNGGNGGAGIDARLLFGTSYGENGYFAGGGGGGQYTGAGGSGGVGGGGNAENGQGSVNTGGGGGGRAAGGSGIVLIKYPETASITVGAGLTSSTTTVSPFKITSFTAGTDTITISPS